MKLLLCQKERQVNTHSVLRVTHFSGRMKKVGRTARQDLLLATVKLTIAPCCKFLGDSQLFIRLCKASLI